MVIGMDVQLSLEVILMLVAVAGIAGFIDAIAGGGGLLTIPAMLLANIPPVLTLGTNKVQAMTGSMAASITMIKKGVVKPSTFKGHYWLLYWLGDWDDCGTDVTA